jgi:hypothetical protein
MGKIATFADNDGRVKMRVRHTTSLIYSARVRLEKATLAQT